APGPRAPTWSSSWRPAASPARSKFPETRCAAISAPPTARAASCCAPSRTPRKKSGRLQKRCNGCRRTAPSSWAPATSTTHSALPAGALQRLFGGLPVGPDHHGAARVHEYGVACAVQHGHVGGAAILHV